jgi:hypothetical protein
MFLSHIVFSSAFVRYASRKPGSCPLLGEDVITICPVLCSVWETKNADRWDVRYDSLLQFIEVTEIDDNVKSVMGYIFHNIVRVIPP